jgi:hypothetical protein
LQVAAALSGHPAVHDALEGLGEHRRQGASALHRGEVAGANPVGEQQRGQHVAQRVRRARRGRTQESGHQGYGPAGGGRIPTL